MSIALLAVQFAAKSLFRMDLAITVTKWVIGPIIGIIVTVIFQEPFRERLVPLLSKLGSKREKGIDGLWKATFRFGTPTQSYVEYIEISSSMGIFVGRIVPNPENYEALKKVEKERPTRVRGTVRDNTFFSGEWLHPIRRSHHHGTFDLIVHRDNDKMEGLWLGYVEARRKIDAQSWIWERVAER